MILAVVGWLVCAVDSRADALPTADVVVVCFSRPRHQSMLQILIAQNGLYLRPLDYLISTIEYPIVLLCGY